MEGTRLIASFRSLSKFTNVKDILAKKSLSTARMESLVGGASIIKLIQSLIKHNPSCIELPLKLLS